MKSATITQAKNGLSALLDLVRAGQTVVITDRGRPVARLEPAVSADDAEGRLLRLERSGTLRVGSAAPPVGLARRPAPRAKPGASAVAALLEERRASR